MFDGIKKAVKATVALTQNYLNKYDMSTKEARERQVKRDYYQARTKKADHTEKLKELDDYYHNRHYAKDQVDALAQKYGWNTSPPVLPDPYIQVESQIDPYVPDFVFKGRDDDLDSVKAKQRQQVVEYLVYNNKLDQLNVDNERNLGKLGNAFWKVSFDGTITGPNFVGDIVIGNPDPANIYPDPAAYDIDDCEYIDYPYRIHRRKARRIFGKILDSIGDDNLQNETEIYENSNNDPDNDTLQVIEHWYRDDEGDIACSIQINNVEVKHIPKYWVNTSKSGNQMYPFVKYCKVPGTKSFWDISEIEMIMDLVDAGDIEFFTAILNDRFMANDIVLMDEKAIIGDALPIPGAVWKTAPGYFDKVKRLGGPSNNANLLNMLKFIHEKIEETNGNISTRGAEPTRVTTSSGLAQLREDRDARANIKKMDRLAGFERLYELLDWTALEFYNTDRIILIRGKNEGEPDQSFVFNSDQYRQSKQQGEELEPEYYYPKVDVEIIAGEGILKSKAFTLSATQELMTMAASIRPDNAAIVTPILISIIDLLDLPNKQEVKEAIQAALQQQQAQPDAGESPIPPEMVEYFNSLPPEQQAQFEGLSAEEGMQLLAQMMGGGAVGQEENLQG
jgi:hypothetical protein